MGVGLRGFGQRWARRHLAPPSQGIIRSGPMTKKPAEILEAREGRPNGTTRDK